MHLFNRAGQLGVELLERGRLFLHARAAAAEITLHRLEIGEESLSLAQIIDVLPASGGAQASRAATG